MKKSVIVLLIIYQSTLCSISHADVTHINYHIMMKNNVAAKELLSIHKDHINTPFGAHGNTFLHTAARASNTAIANHLLSMGADAHKKNKLGQKPRNISSSLNTHKN